MELTSAADLWSTWVDTGVLRPKDYDSDIAERVREALGAEPGADLLPALRGASWTPRDLLQTLAPVFASFSGMLQDLLALYARIGADTATGDNLRIQYEFDELDSLDELLANFREQTTAATRLASRTAIQVSFDVANAFRCPVKSADWSKQAQDITGADDLSEWPFPQKVPAPRSTGAAETDRIVQRWTILLESVFGALRTLGVNTRETTDWLYGDPEPDRMSVAADIAQAATDFWPLSSLASQHTFADRSRAGTLDRESIDGVSAWLDRFTSSTTTEALIAEASDLLLMPSWGKRHELYSAWVTTQVDAALSPNRLEFIVTDGTLRFPFKATRLAELDTADGRVEFWCEMRSALVGAASQKRKEGIQPDYRFVRQGEESVGGTLVAVEVKHYLRSASGPHAEAVTDYASSLPKAAVLLVGHGPLGPSIRGRIPGAVQSQVRIFEHVRPNQAASAKDFREEVARLLPLPLRMPTRIEVRWSSDVHDLDLHLAHPGQIHTSWNQPDSDRAHLRADAFDGGPEIIDLESTALAPIQISVFRFSAEDVSITEAQPVVTIAWGDERSASVRPTGSTPNGRCWQVGQLDADGRFSPSDESSVVGE